MAQYGVHSKILIKKEIECEEPGVSRHMNGITKCY